MWRMFVLLMTLALLTGVLLAVDANPAHAATFTVNSTADPGTGGCDATECTLREAIAAANSAPNPTGWDEIVFNIPTSDPGRDSTTGVFTIEPASSLPTISDPVIIDGYSQPGASPNTQEVGNNAVLKIELNGTNVGAADGLSIGGVAGVLVKGLAINRFKEGAGVSISNPAAGVWVQGNYIGTDATGTQDLGNFYGVLILSLMGNDVNTNLIGDGTPEARNVISGNNSSGVKMAGLTGGNVVRGNYIGTKKDGARALPNGSDGVTIEGASANTIAGVTSSQGNVIAFNGGDGIAVSGNAVGNNLTYNSIFGNSGLGIDLDHDGVTPNDPGDGDTGANNRQNFPVLTSAKTSRHATTIKGALNSTANTTFTVQFFSSPRGSRDEGKKFIGETSVTTDTNGDASFVFTPIKKIGERQSVTATATTVAEFGETSEFSAPKKVARRR